MGKLERVILRDFLSFGICGLFAFMSIVFIHYKLWLIAATFLLITVTIWFCEDFEASKNIALIFWVSGIIEIALFSKPFFGFAFILIGLLLFLLPDFISEFKKRDNIF